MPVQVQVRGQEIAAVTLRLSSILDAMKRILIGDFLIEQAFEILAIHQEPRVQVTFAEMNEIELTIKTKMKMLTNTLLHIFFRPRIQMKARVESFGMKFREVGGLEEMTFTELTTPQMRAYRLTDQCLPYQKMLVD